MKIDTNLIPNFDALPEEAKAAILGYGVRRRT